MPAMTVPQGEIMGRTGLGRDPLAVAREPGQLGACGADGR